MEDSNQVCHRRLLQYATLARLLEKRLNYAPIVPVRFVALYSRKPMPRPRAEPCIELALAIITHAVRAWKRNEYDDDRGGLLMFFHSDWFDFLFQSVVTQTTKSKMFKALGIPAREVA